MMAIITLAIGLRRQLKKPENKLVWVWGINFKVEVFSRSSHTSNGSVANAKERRSLNLGTLKS